MVECNVEFLLPGKSVSEQLSLPKTQQLWVFATRTKGTISKYEELLGTTIWVFPRIVVPPNHPL